MENFSTPRRHRTPVVVNVLTLTVLLATTGWSAQQRTPTAGQQYALRSGTERAVAQPAAPLTAERPALPAEPLAEVHAPANGVQPVVYQPRLR